MIVHIGYSKTGTTWLQKYIFSDSESGFYVFGENSKYLAVDFIYGVNKKSRLNWGTDSIFEFDFTKIMDRLNNADASNKSNLIISNESLIGDINCGGVQGPIIAERIKKTIPNAKILITIREQVSLTKSIYDQYLRSGGVSSIKSYISKNNESYIPMFNKSFLKYYKISKYYEDIFGKDNVLVLPIEMLKNDAEVYFKRLYAFADIKYPESFIKEIIKQPKYNVSNSRLMSALYLLRFFNFLSEPSNFNMRMGKGLLNVKRIFEITRHLVPKKISLILNRKIALIISDHYSDYFAKDNVNLSKKYNLDLKKYGYKSK